MDNENTAQEPQSVYSSMYKDTDWTMSLTQIEKDILRDLMVLRGHDETIRYIQIIVRNEASKIDVSPKSLSREDAAKQLMSLGGIIKGIDKEKSYKDIIGEAISQKYNIG